MTDTEKDAASQVRAREASESVQVDAPPDVPASPLPGSGAGDAPSAPGSGSEELPIARGSSGFATGWKGPPGSQGRPPGVKNGQGKPTHNPSRVHWWYDRLADWMIANPHLSMKDAAQELGRSYAWILQLKNSDTFQRYWRERSGSASAELVGGIKAKAFAASEAALDLLNDKLERMPETFTTTGLLEVVDTTMKRFSPEPLRREAAAAVSVNIGLVSPGELAAARERMRSPRAEGPCRYSCETAEDLVELPPSTEGGGQG